MNLRAFNSQRPLAWVLGCLWLLVACGIGMGADGRILLWAEGTNTIVQIVGDEDEDWLLQWSTNLVTWTNYASFGPLLSGGSNAPVRPVGNPIDSGKYFRAVKTEGLFDPHLLRTIRLTFTQTNWPTLLANARMTGQNVLGNLSMDNGATNSGVGVRYKGNTSYSQSGLKKSVNIQLDQTNASSRLLGFETVNLNNAFGDETILREPLYFTVMHQYAPSPRGAMARLFINGEYWGVYSLAQQEDGDLVREWFPSYKGERWKAANAAGGGTGGAFSGSNAALAFLGTNASSYRPYYELKTTNSTDPWQFLIRTADVLNNTPTNLLRDKIDEVLAVDRWLWFLVLENLFADDDSYFHKGADYGIYYEPESGRIHPIEHDGNEAFLASDVLLSPVQGSGAPNRPVLNRLLGIAEFRQRYLAHMRTALEESYNPPALTAWIDHFSSLSVNAIAADTKKNYTMAAYTNDLAALKMFVTNRYNFLTNHVELRPLAPVIVTVQPPAVSPSAAETPWITAHVVPAGTNGLDSVWLYHRGKSYGRFTMGQMWDDGVHGDGAAGDGLFGAATTNYPSGTKVRFYVEARSANATRAARFAPARAEEQTFSYRVALTTASNTPVVINEVMASNTGTLADPQGEFDDWIELHNLMDADVDLTGHYLSDEPNNPRKWPFPPGTIIPANGFLLVWADEDGSAFPGLHASFKLSASGESLFLTDTDANLNAILDAVTFGAQGSDQSYGRQTDFPDVFGVLSPTPGGPNL